MNRVKRLINKTAAGALVTVAVTASVIAAAASNKPPPPPAHTTNVLWSERGSSRTPPGLKATTLKPAPVKPTKSLPVQRSMRLIFAD
jgi:hypothetical protein